MALIYYCNNFDLYSDIILFQFSLELANISSELEVTITYKRTYNFF